MRGGEPGRAAVLLVNLGSPEAPTPRAVRRFLAEFLSDPRVVELPPWLWRPILHGVVLRVRPRRSARLYRSIWTPEGSPLLAIGRRQARGLAEALAARLGRPLPVALGMRYGRPSLAEALEGLRRQGLERLLVLPLYPQACGATTASTFDALARALAAWRRVPALRFVAGYHDHPGYLEALAASLRRHWAEHGRGERLLLSFHGMPERTRAAGDPYHRQCQETARLLAERLGLPPGSWQVAFQSRFGRGRWLEPATDRVLAAWGREGLGTVDVLCPGFAADCLETLEEIAVQGRETFRAAGGGELRYVPALNDRPEHLAFLAELAAKELQGWPEGPAG